MNITAIFNSSALVNILQFSTLLLSLRSSTEKYELLKINNHSWCGSKLLFQPNALFHSHTTFPHNHNENIDEKVPFIRRVFLHKIKLCRPLFHFFTSDLKFFLMQIWKGNIASWILDLCTNSLSSIQVYHYGTRRTIRSYHVWVQSREYNTSPIKHSSLFFNYAWYLFSPEEIYLFLQGVLNFFHP